MTRKRLFPKLSKTAARPARLGTLALAMVALPVAAHAQFFWPGHSFDDDDDDDAVVTAPPVRPLQRETPHHQRVPKAKIIIKESAKPQGPLLIAISIDDQELKIYDNNGLFAQTPVSTGMRGHATPMGVFSVLAKEKYHRSNIYSNAPMPYMQRITWSGVAIHAGVLPGYPASHGCIRMPMNFAVRMYGWTRNGARVVIAPGELMPTDISHPLLFTHRPEPPKTVALAPTDNAAQAAAPASAAQPAATSGSTGSSQSVADNDDRRQTAAADESLKTADASGMATPLVVSDVLAPKAIKDQKSSTASANSSQNTATETPAIEDKPGDIKNAASADAPAADTPADPLQALAAITPKRWGHIAAFISRKTGRLYVRQNFDPLFDVPVTIADGGPLGTHIFTMRASKDDPKTFQWSVVTMPQHPRAEAIPSHKKRRTDEVAATPVPSASPAEALDRITIPEPAEQKLAEIFSPGDSIVVSDAGLGGETGNRGTDFIVPLR